MVDSGKNFVYVYVRAYEKEADEEITERLPFNVLTLEGCLRYGDSRHPFDHDPSLPPPTRKKTGPKYFECLKEELLSPEANLDNSKFTENILGDIPFPLKNIEWELQVNGTKSQLFLFEYSEEIMARVLEEARCCVESEIRRVAVIILALKRVPLEEYKKFNSYDQLGF